MRKIGTVTPIWNQELFLKPHFDLITQLDRNIVLLQSGPMPNYERHGIGDKPDRSERILREFFPQVEIYDATYPPGRDFGSGLYNEGLERMQDCDIVLRLDVDMIWSPKDFQKMVDYIRDTEYDCYQMNFSADSVNYYMTGDYEHGLKDAQEFDPLGADPRHLYQGLLDYPSNNRVTMDLGITCHHFRGWNKPISTPPGWDKQLDSEYFKRYSNNGEWYVCPDDVRKPMEEWQKTLAML